MKHFEHLWEATEELMVAQSFPDIQEQLHCLVDQLCKEPSPQKFGEILSRLCYLSAKYQINVYSGLLHEYQNQQQVLLEI